jgi:hypothetical protein
VDGAKGVVVGRLLFRFHGRTSPTSFLAQSIRETGTVSYPANT